MSVVSRVVIFILSVASTRCSLQPAAAQSTKFGDVQNVKLFGCCAQLCELYVNKFFARLGVVEGLGPCNTL